METTLTMAGLLADAGAARLFGGALPACSTGAAHGSTYDGSVVHQVLGQHPSASWTKGAIAEPATFMVLARKNRPARPLSELSP